MKVGEIQKKKNFAKQEKATLRWIAGPKLIVNSRSSTSTLGAIFMRIDLIDFDFFKELLNQLH